MTDARYCPVCGESIPESATKFVEDGVLNFYRTEFVCQACRYHGEVFRHNPGDRHE